MEINGDNGALLAFEQEINSMNGSIWFYFSRSKIQDFFKFNGVKLNSLHARRDALNKEYIEHDENGNMLFDGEGKAQQPRLKDYGLREELERKIKEFTDEKLVIRI